MNHITNQTLEEFYLFIPLCTNIRDISLPPAAAGCGSTVELCTLRCAWLQGGVAHPCSLKQLYLPHCMVAADASPQPNFLPSPGVRFPQAQGWPVSARELGRLGRWRVRAGAPSWQGSVDMSMLAEFPFLSVNLGMDPWRPMQIEACGY